MDGQPRPFHAQCGRTHAIVRWRYFAARMGKPDGIGGGWRA